MTTTLDGLLDRRLTVEQPKQGYRIAVDTLLLAAAVSAMPGERVLELGCGVGGAMLALACRVSGLYITGIEIQDELVRLCKANIERNVLPSAIDVIGGDATRLPERLKESYDHVMINPPYHDAARHDASMHTGKKTANTENDGDLALWLENATRSLKDGGMVTMIHRADRKQEIAGALTGSFGDLRIKPVVTKPETPAKRLLLRAQKGGEGKMCECSPFIMHHADGSYTDDAEAVLRHVGPILFD